MVAFWMVVKSSSAVVLLKDLQSRCLLELIAVSGAFREFGSPTEGCKLLSGEKLTKTTQIQFGCRQIKSITKLQQSDVITLTHIAIIILGMYVRDNRNKRLNGRKR